MEPKGSISGQNLTEALQHFCEAGTAGLLIVRSHGDRFKFIEISDLRIAIAAGGDGRRMRLGELLVARDVITRLQREGALHTQRLSDTKFGEALVELGFCTQELIDANVKFQVSEELAELLTWGSGSYEFNEGLTIDGLGTAEMRPTRIAGDGHAIALDVIRSASEWHKSDNKVSSLSCAYKLSDDGRELGDMAEGESKRLIEMIELGFNIQGIIARTSVGRFGVLMAISELVRGAAAVEVGPGELPEFAESLRKLKRYEQAIGAYRRLLEVGPEPDMEARILRDIRHCEEALAAVAATRTFEEARHKRPSTRTAPVPSVVGRRLWQFALVGCIMAIAAIAVTLHIRSAEAERHRQVESADFDKTKGAAEAHQKNKLYHRAKDVYTDFLATYPIGSYSDYARIEIGKIDALLEEYEAEVTVAIEAADALARSGKIFKIIKAIGDYETIIETHPRSKQLDGVKTRLEKAKIDLAELKRRLG